MLAAEVQGDAAEPSVLPGVDIGEIDPITLREIDFDDGKSLHFPLLFIRLSFF